MLSLHAWGQRRTDRTMLSLHAWGQGQTDRTNSRYSPGRKMTSNATWRGNVRGWHARFGLDGGAAIREFHVIQGPNTRDARDKIAFFAFHAFHAFAVEVHANRAKIESGPNYITAAHAFVIATLRLGLRAPLVASNYKVYVSDHVWYIKQFIDLNNTILLFLFKLFCCITNLAHLESNLITVTMR